MQSEKKYSSLLITCYDLERLLFLHGRSGRGRPEIGRARGAVQAANVLCLCSCVIVLSCSFVIGSAGATTAAAAAWAV